MSIITMGHVVCVQSLLYLMSRIRNFAFTCNNYTVDHEELIRGEKYKYLVYGYEISPTTSTPHLQGTICYKNGKSLGAVRSKLVGFHIAPCIDVVASIAYCKKVEGFFEDGTFTAPQDKTQALLLKRKEKAAKVMSESLSSLVNSGEVDIGQVPLLAKAKLVLMMELEPYVHANYGVKRGVWYYGESRTGKSRAARENYPGAYSKAQNKWWDGYTGQSVVILDDLDSHVLGHHLKIWADVYACTGEVKNGHVQLVYHTIVVTSNWSIDELFSEAPKMIQPIKERFHVTRFSHGLN